MSQVDSSAAFRRDSLTRAAQRARRISSRASFFESRFALSRLIVTVILVAILVGVFSSLSFDLKAISIAFFLAVSVALSSLHTRFRETVERWTGLVASYEGSLHRLDRNFVELRRSAPPWTAAIVRTVPPNHPYASDLDVATSLYPLLDTCATAEGSHALFEELLHAGTEPLPERERKLRAGRAAALAKRTQLLREHDALRTNPKAMAEYLRLRDLQQGDLNANIARESKSEKLAIYLTTGAIGLVSWALFLLPAGLKFIREQNSEAMFHAVLTYAIVPVATAIIFKPLVDIATELSRRLRFLDLIIGFATRAGNEPSFQQFSCVIQGAQRELKAMGILLNFLSVRSNPILWLFLHAFIPFDAIVCSLLLLRVRTVGPQLRSWEKDIEEFDLVAAIGRFQSENPECQFFLEENSAAVGFSATALGHPLLPPTARICNDFTLPNEKPMVLLTGSNMSGKSTFLRTLGTNALLFNLGAPVCAKTFSTPPRRLLCAIRVDDSLADGTSYFYAEVKRLKHILETLAESRRNQHETLFLVDEIFRGTNNRERFVGSWHILHALLDSGGLGVVSTHDLALTELDKRDSRLRNLHFREHIEEGRFAFDFQIKEGPCPTTNALAIMRSEGLPIPDDTAQLPG